jgi:carbamoyl-phosphate synthase small subunit
LLGKLPVMGIGRGHLVMVMAVGGNVGKLKAGHHGGNYPVTNLLSGSVAITTQNHSYAARFDSLGSVVVGGGRATVVENASCGRIQLTEANLNDGTVEGLSYLDVKAFGVQYHPEFAPGPITGQHALSGFLAAMESQVGVDTHSSTGPESGVSEVDHA